MPDHYPFPNIANFTSKIDGLTVFSKLDLQKGYYQVPVAPEDIQKTAFITPFGMYKFLCILIFNQDLSSYVDHLREVFRPCRKHGLTIGLPKCKFAVSKNEFLGHLLSTNECSPQDKHFTAISTFHPPSDKPALQRCQDRRIV